MKAVSILIALFVFVLFNANYANAKSQQESEIANRYPTALYMYAGAACKWIKPKRVVWKNATLDEGIHRFYVSNNEGLGGGELYQDKLSMSAADSAFMESDKFRIPILVNFSGWLAECKNDPNHILLADKIEFILSPDLQKAEAK